MPDRIVLSTMGSLGDLHPFIAIALRLKERGYDPVIATSPHFLENVVAEGIRFHPVGPGHDDIFRDLRMDVDEFGRRVMKDTLFILQGAIFPYLERMYEDSLPVIDGAALVLTSSLLYSARFAAEQLGVPQMTVALQPLVFISAYDPPCLDVAPWLAPVLSKLGPGATRIVYGLGKKAASRRAAALYSFRRELGLPEAHSDPLFEGQFSSHGTFALYSSLMGTVQPDFPPKTAITGFTFYDGNVEPALASELKEFLASGPPPLVFTLGSFAVEFADDFFQASLDAARLLGMRAVVLVGAQKSEAYQTASSSDVYVCDYAPFSLLFPYARANIHHGGIGTVGQSLRAGKPQLVVPFLSDQFDNAARVVRLGVARTIARKRYTPKRVAAELRALLSESTYASRAATVGSEISCEDGAGSVTRMIDRFLQSA
jgi:rhamnosyltransferase subunit B